MAFGLLTKTEAKDLRDLRALLTVSQMNEFYAIASDIALVQINNPDRTYSDYNTITRIEVADYFTKAPLAYTVTHSTAGQPAGFTRITRISWS